MNQMVGGHNPTNMAPRSAFPTPLHAARLRGAHLEALSMGAVDPPQSDRTGAWSGDGAIRVAGAADRPGHDRTARCDATAWCAVRHRLFQQATHWRKPRVVLDTVLAESLRRRARR